jgi:formylglycine-generating enzyme required for sulfatase activity
MVALRTPLGLMRLVVKAALNAVGFGVAGDFAAEVLPAMAKDLWSWWAKDKPPQEVAAEVQAVAQVAPEAAGQLASQAVAAEAAAKGPWLRRTTKVGLYPPNELGAYDMHGNVWEWCADAGGPFWAHKVVRGGCWYSPGALCRAAARWTYPPAARNCYIGFRLVAISSR